MMATAPSPRPPVSGHKPDLGVRDMGDAAHAPELPDQLDDVVQARHVRLRQEAAVRVHGQAAAEPEGAALDERAIALLAETGVAELQQQHIVAH